MVIFINYLIKNSKINCLIGSKRIDKGIPNDINGYMILNGKSMLNNKFLINYKDFIDNYRIYSFNIDRIIRDDNSNQQINITCESDSKLHLQYMLFIKHTQQ